LRYDSKAMRFLIGLVRGLHMTIGIHTPPPDQERLYVFVWIGIIVFMAAGLALLFYLLG
jgi:hypothetical protein